MGAGDPIFKVSDISDRKPLVDAVKANAMHAHADEDQEGFWREVAQRITWSKPFSKVKDVSFDADDLHVRWYYDGELNACVNCLDRHLPELPLRRRGKCHP